MSLHSLLKTVFYRLGFSIKKLRPAKVGAVQTIRKVQPGEIRALLHAEDPYGCFDTAGLPLDLHGWGSESPAFRELILRVKPELVIEVGTWKGASALHMADILAEIGSGAHILCIDTWLGALEFWTDQSDAQRYGALKLKNGWPQVYFQFLANVVHKRHQARITPFPQTSATAALWLRTFGVLAELIYLDGSHEEEDVYADCLAYWEVLAPGGILFGDDWSWDGVRLAVGRFAKETGRPVAFAADKWMLVK